MVSLDLSVLKSKQIPSVQFRELCKITKKVHIFWEAPFIRFTRFVYTFCCFFKKRLVVITLVVVSDKLVLSFGTSEFLKHLFMASFSFP